MSSTHPNLIPSNVLSSMRQREDMRKNPLWYFWFDQLWPFNFQFGCWRKSSNQNVLVFVHPILKLKIVSEISWSRESMVRNPFWDFECFTSVNPCDSSTLTRANFWPVTTEKFLRHGFYSFSPKSSILSRISMKVTFWLVNIENSALGLEHPSWSQIEKFSESWRRIGFWNNSKCRIHT